MLCAFGVDVLDPAVSLRRVWVLAQRLPPWARAGGEEWSAETHMLALLVDHVANLAWITLRAAGATSATQPRPVPRPRAAPIRAAQSRPEPPTGTPGGWAAVAGELAGLGGVRVLDG